MKRFLILGVALGALFFAFGCGKEAPEAGISKEEAAKEAGAAANNPELQQNPAEMKPDEVDAAGGGK